MERLRRAWQYGYNIWTAYSRDNGPLMAAAVAFYGLLSLVPLLALGVAVLGMTLGSSADALPKLQRAIGQALPVSSDLIYGALSDIKHSSGVAGLIGLGGLMYTASAIFSNLELALNNMCHAGAVRAWWKQQTAAIGTTALTLVLILLSLAITSSLTWLQNRQVAGLDVGGIPFVWTAAAHVSSLALSILAFAAIYRIVPNCNLEMRMAIEGGLFAGAAWEAAKYLFALYAAHFAHYSRVYGSLGAMVALMFWAYYSATILLIGGEIAAGRGTPAATSEPPGAATRPLPREA